MSFRTRLTSFFLVIVVVPMSAVGLLVFRLITDSEQGKAGARVDGVASVAAGVYDNAARAAAFDARTIARAVADTSPRQLQRQVSTVATRAGLARVTVAIGSRPVAATGDPTAIAPGTAIVRARGARPARTVTASELTAGDYAGQLAGSGVEVVIREGDSTLATTVPAARNRPLPRTGTVTVGGTSYQVATRSVSGFGGHPVQVVLMSDLNASAGSAGTDRIVTGFFIAAFLAMSFCFALLASRALQRKLSSFLEAARRLGSGDFSSPIQTEGHDEFAALGQEFNSMSMQLANRLDELERERDRVRQATRRIGEAFAANLDRGGLLELTLRAAMDATGADRGRVCAREHEAEPLKQTCRVGELDGIGGAVDRSERSALEGDGAAEGSAGELFVASVALGAIVPGGPTHGVVSVCRAERPFSADDLDLLRSLAARATLALANVNLHFDIQRQAVTDDLTGLATHGHFQDRLSDEMVEVRRYHYPVGLIMLDIDDFKSINDLYGHQQGDLVLRSAAHVLRQTSRDPDITARYGGDEMSVILPHTDLEGTDAIAERIRQSIEAMEVPLLSGGGSLQISVSVGAAASSDGHKDELITAADNALYVAKREGKNRTVRATPDTTNVIGGR
jgi:two-component system cell cycle response regulator